MIAKVFADPLIKGLPPSVYRENTYSTWVYGIAYVFRTIKGPKLRIFFRPVMCIVAVESIGN